ncbi:splicing factor 3A subunit 2 isoform X2 [Ceratitis capitata]|uniref:splicing factor 3A subunit 2 isoform X2 n=1 Tax=Ceratitis capitata TaxID=7213 RepID=UPI0006188B59|nr:splicing factor 3A subunit 2 isoform X2 [Ceratitis capitata]
MHTGMIIGTAMGSFIVALSITCFCLAIWYNVRKRRNTHTNTTFGNPPVVVTSTTHTAPGGYPVTQVPPPAVYQQQPMYPPYPTSAGGPVQMPMPMPMPGMHPPAPGMQPYPPAVPAANYNPPSYDAAVAGVGVAQPNTTSNTYEKQAPYNPNYNNAY